VKASEAEVRDNWIECNKVDIRRDSIDSVKIDGNQDRIGIAAGLIIILLVLLIPAYSFLSGLLLNIALVLSTILILSALLFIAHEYHIKGPGVLIIETSSSEFRFRGKKNDIESFRRRIKNS
jgi:hypothetical protein